MIATVIGSFYNSKSNKSESGQSPVCWCCFEVERIDFLDLQKNPWLKYSQLSSIFCLLYLIYTDLHIIL